MPPVATVVIGTRDRPAMVERAVASALGQTLTDVEVVVVDDASDPPFEPRQPDPRLRVVRRDEPGGMCRARNDGLAVATAPWVTFLDDDDELDPTMLERSIAAAASSSLPPPVSVMSTMVVVDPDGRELERCVPAPLRRGEHFLLERRGNTRAKNSLVMPTELVRRIGAWDPDLLAWEADDFGIRLNQASSIEVVPEPLYRMIAHGAARRSRARVQIPLDMAGTLRKHEDVFRQHRAGHAHYMGVIAMSFLQAGRWAAAVPWAVRAVLRDPRRRKLWVWAAAALAGPPGLAAVRGLRPRAGVPWTTLMRRRLVKYGWRAVGPAATALVGPLARALWAVARRRAPALGAPPPASVLLVGVYRRRNSARLRPLLADAERHGWDVRLWALDEVAPELAAWTSGEGPGAKFPLLDRLLVDAPATDWVVVSDDDVVFPSGSLGRFLTVAAAAGLDISQPAHDEQSHRSYGLNRRRLLSVARDVPFVEIGPLFAVRAPWIDRVLPFPESVGMGFGLEHEWADLRAEGAHLGVVDAVPVRHLDPVGGGYAEDAEIAAYKSRLRARGGRSLRDMQSTLGWWRPWQASPPWEDPRHQ